MIELGGGYIREDCIEAIFPAGMSNPFNEFKSDPNKTQYVVHLTHGKAFVATSEDEVRLALMSAGLLDGDGPIGVEMSPDDEDKLQKALAEGYRYIARDKTQQVFAYDLKPRKGAASWIATGGVPRRIKGDFDFLAWEDSDPSEIALLLGFKPMKMDR